MHSIAFIATLFATAAVVIAAPVSDEAHIDVLAKRGEHNAARWYTNVDGHRTPNNNHYGGATGYPKYKGAYYRPAKRSDEVSEKKQKKKRSKNTKRKSSTYVNETGAKADKNGMAAAAATAPNSAMSSGADDDDDINAGLTNQQVLNCMKKSDAQAMIKTLAANGATDTQLAQYGEKVPSLNQKNWKAPSYCSKSKRGMADLD